VIAAVLVKEPFPLKTRVPEVGPVTKVAVRGSESASVSLINTPGDPTERGWLPKDVE
jgi:hypothetical protein